MYLIFSFFSFFFFFLFLEMLVLVFFSDLLRRPLRLVFHLEEVDGWMVEGWLILSLGHLVCWFDFVGWLKVVGWLTVDPGNVHSRGNLGRV